MTKISAANSSIVDQAALVRELRNIYLTEATDEERAEIANSFIGREIYAWGKILSSDDDQLILKAANSREEYLIVCEYPTRAKRENLNLIPNEFTCVKMRVNDIDFVFSDGVEQWSLKGVYDSVCVKKVSFFQRQFEERTKQADRVITKRVKKTLPQHEETATPAQIATTKEPAINGIVKSKKEITEESIRQLVAEERSREDEREDTKRMVWSAFRKSVAVSLSFLFIICFYKMHEGHSFLKGISLGTTIIAIIIGIVVFIRTNMK